MNNIITSSIDNNVNITPKLMEYCPKCKRNNSQYVGTYHFMSKVYECKCGYKWVKWGNFGI